MKLTLLLALSLVAIPVHAQTRWAISEDLHRVGGIGTWDYYLTF